MSALSHAMEQDEEKKLYRMYMAQVGEALASGLGYKVVPFAEVIGLRKMDNRTGDDIADDIIERMIQSGKEG